MIDVPNWIIPTSLGVGMTGFVIVWFIFLAFIILIGLALFALWIIAIIDLVQRKDDEFPGQSSNAKTTWLIILLVSWAFNFSGIAAIIYYFVVMKKMPRKKEEALEKKEQ
jgi:NhaP-type Na+/H+ or K+/H+ antiporter